MNGFDRLNLIKTGLGYLRAFEGVEGLLAESSLGAGLRHLVKLRASQINGCAFCVDMHCREAREDGGSEQRLDRVVVWCDVDDFDAGERAALARTEAVTMLDRNADLDALHAELARHFSEAQIADLTACVAMINVWNRLQVAAHGNRPLVLPEEAPRHAVNG